MAFTTIQTEINELEVKRTEAEREKAKLRTVRDAALAVIRGKFDADCKTETDKFKAAIVAYDATIATIAAKLAGAELDSEK